jgi:hypothetical protein
MSHTVPFAIVGNCSSRVGNRFVRESVLVDAEVVSQHLRVPGKALDPAVGMMKYDEMKFLTASRILSSNVPDPIEQPQQKRLDSRRMLKRTAGNRPLPFGDLRRSAPAHRE